MTVELTFAVLLVTDVAVMVIGLTGIVVGAVYEVEYALEVVVGLNEPHALAGAQLQPTPAFAASFVTLADMFAVAPNWRVAGGADQKAMVTLDAAFVEEPLPPQPARNPNVDMTTTKLFQFMKAP